VVVVGKVYVWIVTYFFLNILTYILTVAVMAVLYSVL